MAVFKWRMKPEAMKPLDLTKGREQVIEFRQEAPVAALYRDRTAAAFSSLKEAERWMYAPFPPYSEDARLRHKTGKVVLKVRIGRDGSVGEIQKLQSSGYTDLDDAAVAAVRHWRAHKRFVGTEQIIPINFTMDRRWRDR